MHVLALDTTTRDGSVALVEENRVVDERRGDMARSHAERLPGELIELASAHGVPLGAIDLFAVASGPGSFTGLRIGIATIQGLALAAGRRIVAVSALEALALSVQAAPGAYVAAWMDARRHDVFAALYRIADAPPFSPERLVEVDGSSVGAPAAILARWTESSPSLRDAAILFVGDGALLYAETIRSVTTRWTVAPDSPLLAGAIGRMAVARAERGDTIDPAAVRPLYIRRPDAEIERDRRLVKHDGRVDD